MSPPSPNWRCFEKISADAEASSFSAFCLFSLATLEVACDAATNRFALTERERLGLWRWAIISERGEILSAGCETTQVAAKRFASAALHDDGAEAHSQIV
jgi:hypothetical protein